MPENDRLEAVGYMIDKLLEICLLLNDKQLIACFKPMFELCMVSKTFIDEEVTNLTFTLFGTLITQMGMYEEALQMFYTNLDIALDMQNWGMAMV